MKTVDGLRKVIDNLQDVSEESQSKKEACSLHDSAKAGMKFIPEGSKGIYNLYKVTTQEASIWLGSSGGCNKWCISRDPKSKYAGSNGSNLWNDYSYSTERYDFYFLIIKDIDINTKSPEEQEKMLEDARNYDKNNPSKSVYAKDKIAFTPFVTTHTLGNKAIADAGNNETYRVEDFFEWLKQKDINAYTSLKSMFFQDIDELLKSDDTIAITMFLSQNRNTLPYPERKKIQDEINRRKQFLQV